MISLISRRKPLGCLEETRKNNWTSASKLLNFLKYVLTEWFERDCKVLWSIRIGCRPQCFPTKVDSIKSWSSKDIVSSDHRTLTILILNHSATHLYKIRTLKANWSSLIKNGISDFFFLTPESSITTSQ